MISAIRLFFLLFWTLSLMFFSPFLILLTFNRQFPLVIARTLFSTILLKIAGAKLTTYGVESVPTDKPVIFIANHCSHIDIGILCKSLPLNLHFIGKKELAWVPIVGWYMFVTGHIFIDRSNKRKAITSLKKAAVTIRNGKSVIMFPEGTRSKTGEISEFKKGAFHLALDAEVSIVPVHIKGTYSLWPATSNTITPGNVIVHIGKPIDFSKYTKKTVKIFAAEAKTAIEEMGK